ncbi:MAG: hypothetical protein N2505_06170 [Endomicrobia bacterium]|nr:hypothetical protein [Endomicrobiia bacterium]
MAKTENNQLPESPTSATLSAITPKGYSILLTIRDEKLSELVKKIDWVENWFDVSGYKPQPQKFGQNLKEKKEVKFVEGRTCPKCGGRLIEKVSKAGKKYNACEKGKYNFKTKQVEGCQFVEWL